MRPACELTFISDDVQLIAAQRALQSRSLDLESLGALWKGHRVDRWAAHPDLYELLATRLLEQGSPLLAHDVVVEGLEYWPRHSRLRQLRGLALARSGAPHRANAILSELYREGDRSSETLGILARTHKDLALRQADTVRRDSELQLSHNYYLAAFRTTADSYPGVNAATTALALGQVTTAESLAREVRERCEALFEECRRNGEDCY